MLNIQGNLAKLKAKSRCCLLILALFLLPSLYYTPQVKGKTRETTPPEKIFKVEANLVRAELLSAKLQVYRIKNGDNLYRISKSYFVSITALCEINLIQEARNLQIGEQIYIPPVNQGPGILKRYCVKTGDTVENLMRKHGLSKWQWQRLNPTSDGRLIVGAEVTIPVAEVSNNPKVRLGLMRPVRGYLTSRYGFRWGRMHYGLDLAAPSGAPVKAAASGRVAFAGWNGAYGLMVKIKHGKIITYYGHLSKILVSPNARIGQGTIIGLVGATGRAYGSHLHFEVEAYGRKVNPLNYLTSNAL